MLKSDSIGRKSKQTLLVKKIFCNIAMALDSVY